ncbi:MAG: hypothetical protein ABI983_03190 [Acidobacteriota bacterium]
MRRLITTAAILVAALQIHIDSVSLLPLAAQDRVAGIISATRKALGGEDKIAGLKGLTAEGPFRRAMGGRDMDGTVTVTIARPDKLKRVEEMQMGGMVGGPSIERTSVLAGTTAWDDMANRGGMGGGMQIVMREGPGPGGPGGGPAPTPEQQNEARVRRMRVQLQRLTAALLADAGTPWVDAGIAESPDGKADILEAKEETGRTLRLFIDQATHMPLMVQYQDPKPMIMINGGPGRGPGGPGRGPGGAGAGGGGTIVESGGSGGGGGVEQKAGAMAGAAGQDGTRPTPEEIQKRIAEMQRNPPQLGTFAMHLSDYKKVDGIMLPHKIETSLDGEPTEEWTIEKYKVNPQIKPDTWEKK